MDMNHLITNNCSPFKLTRKVNIAITSNKTQETHYSEYLYWWNSNQRTSRHQGFLQCDNP